MKLPVDYEMLKEDLSFPLKTDSYHIYIFDNKNNMVANVLTDADKFIKVLKKRVCTDLREFTGESSGKYIIKDDIIQLKELEIPTILIRGWGRLQYKDNAINRQRNILNYLLNCMNFEN